MLLAPPVRSRRSRLRQDSEPVWVDEALLTPMPSPVQALRRPDDAAAAVAVLAPVPQSWAALLPMDPAAMSETGLIDALVASEKLLASIAASQQVFLAEVARRDPEGELFLRDEAACALKVAPGTAHQRLEDATQLTGRLSVALDLQESGRLSSMNARLLARAVQDLPDDVAARVQARVLPGGCAQTPGEFRAAVRRAVARFDRKDERERHAQAYAKRHVRSYPVEDHMADVLLHLGADGAAVVNAAIDAWAVRTDPGDRRSADQRRADAIVDICSHALALPGVPRRHGIRPAINVTVAASTLAGSDEQPAHLDGYGPIPAAMARRLAALPGARRHQFVVDGEGRILDLQAPDAADSYTPPVRIARHVLIRDQYCVMPGCPFRV
ncbi:MAG: DUF222 domain-containing protein [Jatrophihabitans sp.]|nr:MAG: DUF222 domain-containing protein [Jatrophihabitans sp.]